MTDGIDKTPDKAFDKTRIVVTCPQTGVVIITRLTYDEMVKPRATPLLFACACGETHKLALAGKIRRRHHTGLTPRDKHRAS